MLPIYVVNNFGQFNHLIHRAMRDLDIDVSLIPNTTPKDQVAGNCRGIILGGGPALDRAGNCAQYLDLGLPGSVSSGKSGGYGPVDVEIVREAEILTGYPTKISVWASHADEVSRVPEGFIRLARSSVCGNEALALPDKHIYGLQWHPEVSHTFEGKRIFENFNRICRENS